MLSSFSRPAALRSLSHRVAVASTTATTTSAGGGGSVRHTTAVALANAELEKGRKAIDDEKSPTQKHMEAMTKIDPNMVYGSLTDDPPPVMPDEPSEISALDPAHLRDSVLPDGFQRLVHIRQDMSSPTQSPNNEEKSWIISFQDQGETSKTWDNPLMGWVSGADPMASNIDYQMSFATASDAVYFAKKRGWQYVVEKPIFRRARTDQAQYQDNFLPQLVATKLRLDRKLCNHWERPAAGTSHYARPLKYHGDGESRQHGPNMNAKVAAHVPGYYKMR